jgi:hypothetical protein
VTHKTPPPPVHISVMRSCLIKMVTKCWLFRTYRYRLLETLLCGNCADSWVIFKMLCRHSRTVKERKNWIWFHSIVQCIHCLSQHVPFRYIFMEPVTVCFQRLLRALSLGLKRPGREADHSTPSSTELYLHSPNTSSWCCLQLSTETTLPLTVNVC